MQLQSFRDLLTPPGQAALAVAEARQPQEVDFLAHFQALCRQYPADLARAALETAILRREAAVKFPFASRLYLTREALEQASRWEIATYRADRYRGLDRLADLGCSVGIDSLALAGVAPTIGIDIVPLRLSMASANACALGLECSTSYLLADLRVSLPLASTRTAWGLFFDPARRSAGRRAWTVGNYAPPLSVLSAWLPLFPTLGVKASPGVDLTELRDYDCEVEFISLTGELKEAALWFGPLKSTHRRATLLPGPYTLTETEAARLELREPGAYLYEPDPAILRAGLVGELGLRLGAGQLDADIAYLTADAILPTPFARTWVVEDWLPFGLRRLRAYLHQRRIGRVIIKKRGSPLEPEKLVHELRLSGEGERVLFLTHLRGEPVVIVALPTL